jgi:hypothetical protein
MFEEKETPEQRIAKIDAWMETLKKDRETTAAKLPGGTQSVVAQVEQEDRDAATFDKLSPRELMELYTNSREEWQRLLDAKERVGLRKLMAR